jgi:protein TonB
MRFSHRITIIAVLLLLLTTVSTSLGQGKKPITKDQLIYLIKAELTEPRLVGLIEKYGIGFAATPRVIEELLQAQAGPLIIELVNRYGQKLETEETSPGPKETPPATEKARISITDYGHKPIRVGGDVQASKLIKKVEPVYPELAKEARVSGIVILQVTINAEGLVEDVKVLRGNPLLDDAAVEAVRQWVYTPTTLNGEPVPVVATVTVNFTLK